MATSNGTTIRLDVTPFGFHAMVLRPDGVAWYVEPATRNVGESRVLSFPGGAAGAAPEPFVEKQVREAAQQAAPASDESFSTPGGVVTQRTFNLAFLTDPTYAAFVAPGAVTHATSDPLVLAAKVSLINRVNQVYNDDVAYKFLLVAGTDTKLNLLTAAEMTGTERPLWRQRLLHGRPRRQAAPAARSTATYSRSASWSARTPTTSATSASVSTAAASLGSVPSAAQPRPGGCTGLPQPIGDVYAIDYVAHEMGHQMGGYHTFNGTQVNCTGGNRNAAELGGAGLGHLDPGVRRHLRERQPPAAQRPVLLVPEHRPVRGDHGGSPGAHLRDRSRSPSPASTTASR